MQRLPLSIRRSSKLRLLLSASPAVLIATVVAVFAAGCAPPAPPAKAVQVKDAAKIQEATPVQAAQGDWPWWRGPGNDNIADGEAPPVKWSNDKNIVWSVDVPGRGHASPVVVGDKVFVATADESAETMMLLCYARETGAENWRKELHSGGFPHKHKKNTHASATPACDGDHVYTVFLVDGAVWVSAVDLGGEIVWQKEAGKFVSKFGYGSSPIIYKSLLIIQGDNSGGGFLTALYRETGEIAWRAPRKSVASFGTPLLTEAGGKPQLLLPGQNLVVSYNPATGEELWRQDGTASTAGNTMAVSGETVFASGGYPERNIQAMNASDGEVLWSKDFKVYLPSLLAYEDRVLAVQDDGVARLFQAQTGDEIWKKRLGGGYSASPVNAGNAIYVPAEDGTVHVFKASGDSFEEIATNKLAGSGFASPVIASGRIYLRTGSKLFCIGK